MQYSKDQILEMTSGKYFGEGNAQLPADQMLMVDQIDRLELDGGEHGNGLIEATFHLQPEHWFFGCHFIGDPVMPGCLGLDALWQLTGLFMAFKGVPGRGRATGVRQVKFTGQIFPTDDKIQYRINIRKVKSRPLGLALADGEVIKNGEVIYQAQGLQVAMMK
ncbi:bifunctional 3-hydroxydecanoyl-ACP dehydratase/trans-2-decenoyl-ACP isomerase [Salinibius halmophilus]|uniref:bifunctional 3-hydroxydecanoyl-ACP dehydratase/trans-2-decenoyl-ACP isomerase n=1 Tax=Salinibius halmophilus TaxID=1853216 RepID=UPI000E674482|nr:bifunctional 3-hydroxydecanoyl-ACP dehydratase/trans-2-decenoyl-ACP isomerase [Salinibius halmophilus]